MLSRLSKQNIAVDIRAINENGNKYLGNILNNQSYQFSVCPDCNQRVLCLNKKVKYEAKIFIFCKSFSHLTFMQKSVNSMMVGYMAVPR